MASAPKDHPELVWKALADLTANEVMSVLTRYLDLADDQLDRLEALRGMDGEALAAADADDLLDLAGPGMLNPYQFSTFQRYT
jgi:hypothetical protein